MIFFTTVLSTLMGTWLTDSSDNPSPGSPEVQEIRRWISWRLTIYSPATDRRAARVDLAPLRHLLPGQTWLGGLDFAPWSESTPLV
jgi:hypothetical protein